jgi:hypothetical protein
MKLISFVDSDGNEVWINPDKVCRVLTRKEHCSIYTEDGGMTWLSMPASMAISILEGKATKLLINVKPKKGLKK